AAWEGCPGAPWFAGSTLGAPRPEWIHTSACYSSAKRSRSTPSRIPPTLPPAQGSGDRRDALLHIGEEANGFDATRFSHVRDDRCRRDRRQCRPGASAEQSAVGRRATAAGGLQRAL